MNINRLIKELKNGNNPEEKLSDYSQLLLMSYIRLSYGRFALDFTKNYDYLAEEEDSRIKEPLCVVVDTARRLCSERTDAAPEHIGALDDARTHVIDALNEMEAYLHYFMINEHLINRMFYKFEERLSVPDTETFVTSIMAYICEKQDAESMNERIQAVLGELPVRMTTVKFNELLENGCMCYMNARSDMAQNFFSGMMRRAKAPELSVLSRSWPRLYELAEEFSDISYGDLTKEKCKDLIEKIQLAATIVAGKLGNLMDMLNLINELYILVIAMPYTVSLPSECHKLSAVLRAYLKAVDSGDFLDIDEDILGELSKTVENQEKYMGEHMFMEDALEDIARKNAQIIDGMMLGGVYQVLHTAQRLFAPSSREDVKDIKPYHTVGKEEIQNYIRDLEAVYAQSFKNCSQMIKRALISSAFDNMPVPFDHLDKVEAFIRQSLEACTEHYEKAAVEALLEDFIKAQVI